jgi:hydroxymethylbilane synthase
MVANAELQRTYKLGTRASPLALKQAEELLGELRKASPELKTEIITIETTGDKDRETPISDIEGSDFFTREIDRVLLKGKIDFAVHSAKDLADGLDKGLIIAAMTASIDPYDVLVSRSGLKLDELPPGAKIGTSSRRRKSQLKKYRSDFQIVDIRGNIEERLKLLDNGIPSYAKASEGRRNTVYPPTPSLRRAGGIRKLDAVVLGPAGLLRLGLAHRITQRIPFKILKPHPLQGKLAVVTRADEEDIIQLCKKICRNENT